MCYLLDDVGAELLLGQDGNVTGEAHAQGLRERGLAKVNCNYVRRIARGEQLDVLTDVLNNIVTEGILDKSKSVGGDVLNELTLLDTRSVIDTALKNAASVAMGADGDTVGSDSIEDELSILRGEMVQALLDDVVAVQVLNQVNDLVLQGVDDDLNLVASRNVLDHLLQSASAVLVERDLNHLWSSVADKRGTLLVVGVLKQLLAEIIAEWICTG